ncbi:MAG: nitrate- and nitrite sensing domain-containing protein [Anaerolineae bacterium]|nr:nitrate- and nitrite sensing domain-containing protein [Anaerolineae bacterium]
MQSVIAPAVALMNRLKYLQKFLLISFLFALPLTIVMIQYLANVAHDIEFSAKEQVGLRYNAPLFNLLALVERDAVVVSASLTGDEAFKADVTAIQQAIEDQISAVDAVDAELGHLFKASAPWSAIKDEWTALRDAIPTLTAAESTERHTALTNRILALITQVGNQSNLILDPDIDTYYLMDTAVTILPQTIGYFGQLRSYGTTALVSETLTPADQTRLVILSELARASLDANQIAYGYAFDYNLALKARLVDDTLNNYQAFNSVLDLLNASLLAESSPSQMSANSEQYFSLSTQALDEGVALYGKVSENLNDLIQKRVDGFVNGRTLILVISFLALAGTVYVFMGFYLSVRRTITAIAAASERIVTSRIPGELVLESRDELAEAAIAFNNVAKDLDLARRESEEATRMKDLFLATMSHELRTPLNAMIGFLHLMIFSGQMDDDNTHMAERSLANTQRLLTLINNILDLSRIATGGLEIVPTPTELRYVAAGLYSDLKLLAQEKGVRLDLEVDQALPERINHDEARISQILTNLVGNAIKFTEKGTVQMALRRRDDRLVIEVADTGVGIPASKQYLIFDDFFQVDSTSTRKHQGAGLGLAIVKRLVLLMNGNINLVSEVGKGSTFTIELPLNLPHYEPSDRRKQAENVFSTSMNGKTDPVLPIK